MESPGGGDGWAGARGSRWCWGRMSLGRAVAKCCLLEVSPAFTELPESSSPCGGTKNPHPAPFLARWESLSGGKGQRWNHKKPLPIQPDLPWCATLPFSRPCSGLLTPQISHPLWKISKGQLYQQKKTIKKKKKRCEFNAKAISQCKFSTCPPSFSWGLFFFSLLFSRKFFCTKTKQNKKKLQILFSVCFLPGVGRHEKNPKIKAAASPPLLAEMLFLVGLSSPTPVEATRILCAPWMECPGFPRDFQQPGSHVRWRNPLGNRSPERGWQDPCVFLEILVLGHPQGRCAPCTSAPANGKFDGFWLHAKSSCFFPSWSS